MPIDTVRRCGRLLHCVRVVCPSRARSGDPALCSAIVPAAVRSVPGQSIALSAAVVGADGNPRMDGGDLRARAYTFADAKWPHEHGAFLDWFGLYGGLRAQDSDWS